MKYELNRRAVLEMFEDRWVPIALFRRVGQGFFHGPTNWARLRIAALATPDQEGNDTQLTVALDTTLLDFIDGRPYLAPSRRDAEAGLVFALANQYEPVAWFLGEEWIRLWVNELFRELLQRRQSRHAGRRRADPVSDADIDEELSATGWAEPLLRYAALLDLLDRAETLPENFRMVDLYTGGRQRFIDCDLVLDVGNSRTCGLIVERDGSGSSLGRASKLEVRDLSEPTLAYTDPFESRIEFARASFGRNHLSHRSGRSDAFEWPSLTRVGDEAARLAGLRAGNEGNTGMSSPKRYLWSIDPANQPWRLNQHSTEGDAEPVAAQGPFAVFVNDFGQPLHLMADDDPDRLPAMEPRYSRSNLYAFALTEILLHAITMINAPGHRLRQPDSENPRRLRRIIMTMPSAMPLAERRILRERAAAARDLAYIALGLAKPAGAGVVAGPVGARPQWDERGVVEPEIVIVWDEASATQVVYLYTQIARNFSGHAASFFDVVRRPDNPDRQSLRVATVDIGGGTTDLVITSFHCEGGGANVTIFPEQLFREGFNLAGDDLVLQVVQSHVLEPIERAVEAAGVPSGSAFTADLFGASRHGVSVTVEARRQQFALQVAQPMAINMLARYENSEESGDRSRQAFKFAELFGAGRQPGGPIVDWINEQAAQRGGQGFDLRTVEFPVDFEALGRTVAGVFGPILGAFAEVIWRYRCDLLLLSGRPSRLPAIHKYLAEALPMYCGRIVPLHHFRVGQWYPFRDLQGRIDDPKTTAAVGAMLCARAEGGIEGFNFRSDRIRNPKSTARFIGKLDGNGLIPADDAYYADLDLDDPTKELPDRTFEFRGVMTLGFRQFPNPWWPATQLYTLDFANDAERQRLFPMTPISVQLTRRRQRQDEKLSEDLIIAAAHTSLESGERQVRNALVLKLQTLRDGDGYWLDTGVLRYS